MGDKDIVKLVGERVKKSLAWQERVKAESIAAAKEVEEQERQEQG